MFNYKMNVIQVINGEEQRPEYMEVVGVQHHVPGGTLKDIVSAPLDCCKTLLKVPKR